jgi:hypothetical protein
MFHDRAIGDAGIVDQNVDSVLECEANLGNEHCRAVRMTR